MAASLHELRPKTGGDSEKITINLGCVDLGHVDLLVAEGVYGNRTDFIRSAIRGQLATHSGELAQSLGRHSLELGLREVTVAELEDARKALAELPS